jgi:hypothetical protein
MQSQAHREKCAASSRRSPSTRIDVTAVDILHELVDQFRADGTVLFR